MADNYTPGTGPRDEKEKTERKQRETKRHSVAPPQVKRQSSNPFSRITRKDLEEIVTETGVSKTDFENIMKQIRQETEDKRLRDRAFHKYVKRPSPVIPQRDPCRPLPENAFICEYEDSPQEIKEKTRLQIERGNRPPGASLVYGPLVSSLDEQGNKQYRASGRTPFDNNLFEAKTVPLKQALIKLNVILGLPFFPGRDHIVQARTQLQESMKNIQESIQSQNIDALAVPRIVNEVNRSALDEYIKVEQVVTDITLEDWESYNTENDPRYPVLIIEEDKNSQRLLRFWVHVPTLQVRENELGVGRLVTHNLVQSMIEKSENKVDILQYLLKSASGFITIIDSQTGDLRGYASVNRGLLNGACEYFGLGPNYQIDRRLFFRQGKQVYRDTGPSNKNYCLDNGSVDVSQDDDVMIYSFTPRRYDGVELISMHKSDTEGDPDDHKYIAIFFEKPHLDDMVTFRMIYHIHGQPRNVRKIERTIITQEGIKVRRDKFRNSTLIKTEDYKTGFEDALTGINLEMLFPFDMSFYKGEIIQMGYNTPAPEHNHPAHLFGNMDVIHPNILQVAMDENGIPIMVPDAQGNPVFAHNANQDIAENIGQGDDEIPGPNQAEDEEPEDDDLFAPE